MGRSQIAPIHVADLPSGTRLHGPSPGDWRVADLPGGESLISPLQWGATSPIDVATAEDVREACDVLGFPSGGTLARRAFLAWAHHLPGWQEFIASRTPQGEARTMPTAYRALWRNVHIGPMFSERGQADRAWHYDRRRAYLRSFELPLPVARTERRLDGDTVARMLLAAADRDEVIHGVAYAVMDTTDCPGPIGPLPASCEVITRIGDAELRTPRTVYPHHEAVTGCWPLPLLVLALRCGARIVEVIEGVTVEVAPYLAPLAELLDNDLDGVVKGSPAETALKSVYQRSWLKTKPGAWKSAVIQGKSIVLLPDVDLEALWRKNKHWPLRTLMRPDLSWYVSLWNVVAMQAAIQMTDSIVVAAHVDSLHTLEPLPDGIVDPSGETLGAFRPINEGPARFYGPGQYAYNDEPRPRQGIGTAALHRLDSGDAVEWTDRPAWSVWGEEFTLNGWLRG